MADLTHCPRSQPKEDVPPVFLSILSSHFCFGVSYMLLLSLSTRGLLVLNGKLRETNKGVERGRGIPTERGNPALAFLGAAAGVFSGYLEIFVVR